VGRTTDIGGIGQVVGLHLLRHRSPDVYPAVVVACCERDAGRSQREAEKPAKAESARHRGEGQDEMAERCCQPSLSRPPRTQTKGYLSSTQYAGTRSAVATQGRHDAVDWRMGTRNEEARFNQAK